MYLFTSIATVPADASTTVDFTWLFVKMLAVLGVVIVLAVVIMKYLAPKMRSKMGGYFDVLGRQALEGKKSLYFIKVLERYFVLGVSENAINKIAEIDKSEVEGGKES